MFKGWRFVALMFAFMLPMAFANAPALFAQNTAKVHKLVIQVSRDDTEGINLALGNAVNYKNYYDAKHEQFQVEIVAYGPGITMLPRRQVSGEGSYRRSEESDSRTRAQHVRQRQGRGREARGP